jgi:hypothetical protein
MEVDNNEWKTITQAINTWVSEGKISPEKAEELRRSYSLKKTGQQIAQYFFLIALSCTLMAFGAIFIDEKLLEKIKIYFSLNNIVVAILMALIAGSWFYYIKRKSSDLKTIAYEIYMVLGGLASVTSLVYFIKDFGYGPSYSHLLFFTTILIFSLSIYFRSTALWIAALGSLISFFSSFTYAHSHDHAFLGMNYPVRFTLFALLLLIFSFYQQRIKRVEFTQRVTYIAAFILFFISLWAVSIFGNYTDLSAWYGVRQTHVLVYGFIFGIASLASLYLGIQYKDDVARDLGILFLLVNFYTRYFEYFWDTMHKGLFFLILAVSFWFLGRWIEKRRKLEKS